MKNKKLAVKILSVAFAVTALLSGCSNSRLTPDQYITLNEYTQIQMGMSYETVCSIIGGYGTITYESQAGNLSFRGLRWQGNGNPYSYASIVFQNGKVSSKSQYGLL